MSFVEHQPRHAHVYAPFHSADEQKIENHAATVALHFIPFNLAQVLKTLRIIQAMAADLADHVWSYEVITVLAN